ncbi:MAG: hypothetical protein ABSC37_13925 [Xanthobacteraceae bacterium]
MTAQIHERLILDGEELSMAYCPELPEHHARLRELSKQEMDARLKQSWKDMEAAGRKGELPSLAFVHSTGCWRRYLGAWEVRDGQFFLIAIEGRYELLGDGPLLADWFTGVLRVPEGKILTYVHMGFGSVYEKELHIHIERGVVTGRRIYDNRGKTFDEWKLGLDNLPGGENRFRGDRDFN